jgi:hypothetical protein
MTRTMSAATVIKTTVRPTLAYSPRHARQARARRPLAFRSASAACSAGPATSLRRPGAQRPPGAAPRLPTARRQALAGRFASVQAEISRRRAENTVCGRLPAALCHRPAARPGNAPSGGAAVVRSALLCNFGNQPSLTPAQSRTAASSGVRPGLLRARPRDRLRFKPKARAM